MPFSLRKHSLGLYHMQTFLFLNLLKRDFSADVKTVNVTLHTPAVKISSDEKQERLQDMKHEQSSSITCITSHSDIGKSAATSALALLRFHYSTLYVCLPRSTASEAENFECAYVLFGKEEGR